MEGLNKEINNYLSALKVPNNKEIIFGDNRDRLIIKASQISKVVAGGPYATLSYHEDDKLKHKTYASTLRSIYELLNLSNDDFIRLSRNRVVHFQIISSIEYISDKHLLITLSNGEVIKSGPSYTTNIINYVQELTK